MHWVQTQLQQLKRLNLFLIVFLLKGIMKDIYLKKSGMMKCPDLEGMHPDDPILAEIVQNEKWTANNLDLKVLNLQIDRYFL